MNRQSVHTTCIPIYHLRSGTLFQFILSFFDPVLPLTDQPTHVSLTVGRHIPGDFARMPSWHKNKKCRKSYDSSTSLHLSFSFVTPERFTLTGAKLSFYQYFRILENHGCSLFAHPEISIFVVCLLCKDSNNILI